MPTIIQIILYSQIKKKMECYKQKPRNATNKNLEYMLGHKDMLCISLKPSNDEETFYQNQIIFIYKHLRYTTICRKECVGFNLLIATEHNFQTLLIHVRNNNFACRGSIFMRFSEDLSIGNDQMISNFGPKILRPRPTSCNNFLVYVQI